MSSSTHNKNWHASGKLLISGEYAVLDGALSLAIPTRKGQSLKVVCDSSSLSPELTWEALRQDGSLWFSAKFKFGPLELIETSHPEKGEKLLHILKAARMLNKDFFDARTHHAHCVTQLEFPEDWGWGSSSTLIWLLSEWTGADPFILNRQTFKTSGFDVACAGRNAPLLYQLKDGEPSVEEINFDPSFANRLFFVHLNQKQDTAKSVSENYHHSKKDPLWIREISDITRKMTEAETLEEMEELIGRHEDLISKRLDLQKVKDRLFPDYSGAVKSLGAWGGDFVMVTERDDFPDYFTSKGYRTILNYRELYL